MIRRGLATATVAVLAATAPAGCESGPDIQEHKPVFGFYCEGAEGAPRTVELLYASGSYLVATCLDPNGNQVRAMGGGLSTGSESDRRTGYSATVSVTVTGPGDAGEPSASFGTQFGQDLLDIPELGAVHGQLDPRRTYCYLRFGPDFSITGASVAPVPGTEAPTR